MKEYSAGLGYLLAMGRDVEGGGDVEGRLRGLRRSWFFYLFRYVFYDITELKYLNSVVMHYEICVFYFFRC